MFKLAVLIGLGVGFSTVIGSIIAFGLKDISHKVNDAVLGFAAGVMLAASIFGLIIPSMEAGSGVQGLLITIAGIFTGALFINLMDRYIPHLHSFIGKTEQGNEIDSKQLNKILLFVLAIAIHNFPEGIAVGVGFGSENISNAISVAIGISLQNIPEGMVTIFPLIAMGVKKRKALGIALFTGLTEFVGTMLGFGAISVASFILPFALAFAGGTMLYVISDEMIPETHSHGYERIATYSLLVGFVFMMVIDQLV